MSQRIVSSIDSRTDLGENFDLALDIDDQITRTGPYVRHYRSVMQRQFQLPNTVTAQPAIKEVQVPHDIAPMAKTPQSIPDAIIGIDFGMTSRNILQ
jgi:hypothetical protein